MTEQDSKDKYIKCSRCKCKYINDDDHVKTDFGYSRLNERYKTCVKCRERNNIQNQVYRENHKDEIKEREKQYKKDNREYYNELSKLSKIKKMATPCENGFQRCTSCANAKGLSNYGQYLNRSEEVVRYVQCIDCRNTKDAWVLKNK